MFFFLLGYLILYVAFAPIVRPLAGVANLLFLENPPTFDQEKVSLYSGPASEPPAASSVEEQPDNRLKLSEITFPSFGDHFGEVVIESASVQADLYYGDNSAQLNAGVGMYTASYIPGYGGTTLIAGHNHTFFHTLGQVSEGDSITVSTHYGTYVYRVTGTQVAQASDKTAYDLARKGDKLILYTCYPFDELGLTPTRFFVYADYVSGPQLDTEH